MDKKRFFKQSKKKTLFFCVFFFKNIKVVTKKYNFAPS